MAERCLAKAPTLARKSTSGTVGVTIAASTTPAVVVQEPSAAVDFSWLPWGHGGGESYTVGDFEAAQAAAREAEENYTLAGNPEGALRARRTELSLRGDEALVAVAPLSDQRAYDAVLEGLERARRLYADAGPEGSEGLRRTRDPTGLVKEAAMRDGQRLKGEAVRALRDGRIQISTELCEQAQGCFLFADREGLADATADVKAAIHMVKRLASGDAVVLEAEAAALGDAASDRAVELLRKAKSFYHDAQLSYEGLVDQVTSLLEERPDDPGAVRKAMDLQDNINGIYDSRRDGQRAVKVESRLDCLAADASLENLAQVVDHGQFEGARTLLSSASLVYERSADQARLSKAARIHCLVGLVEKAAAALEEGRYTEAEDLIDKCLQTRSALAVERPFSLRPPCCALFQGGEGGAKTALLLRVHAAGDINRATALTLLEEGDFEAAKTAAASASMRFTWWASHGADEEEDDHPRSDRQEVVRQAEELTTRIATAAGKSQAEQLTREGRDLKATGDSAGAVRALSAAARLFRDVGLFAAAAATHAEASRTEAEALLLTCTSLHKEGKFDAVADQLQKAEALLLEATQAGSIIISAVAKDQQRDPVDAAAKVETSGGGGDITRDDVPADADGLAQSILDDLYNFRCRVAGDVVMHGVAPALEEREYDLALRLMLESDDQYTRIKVGRWMTSAVVAAGKVNVGAASSPKELAVKRAAQDGDRLRAEAASAILKDKNPAKAQELLSRAEACMVWAGVDPFAAGAGAVAKDIRVFEARAEGDKKCQGLARLLLEGETDRANHMFEETLTKYRQGDAFKQIADMRAIMFCVERETNLCRDVISTVTVHDPAACLKILEETRPVFKIGADMRSAVLRDVIDLMGIKYRHIVVLSTICRAWMQCINGVAPPSGGETVPDPGVTLKGAVFDLQALMTSGGAAALEIPFNLIQDACCSVSVKVNHPPPTEEPIGAPEPTAPFPGESPPTFDEQTAGDGSSVRPQDSDDDRKNCRVGSGSSLQGTQGNNAGATDEGIGGDIGRPPSKEDAAVVVDGSTITTPEEEEEGSPSLEATARVFEGENGGGGGVASEPNGGGEHTDGGSVRLVSVEDSDFQADGDASTAASFARADGTTTVLVDTAVASSGDPNLNQRTSAIELAEDIGSRGGVRVEQLQAPTLETSLSAEGNSLVRSPSAVHQDVEESRRDVEESRPEEDSDVSYDLGDDFAEEDDPLSSPAASASRNELSQKNEPLPNKSTEESDDASSNTGTVLSSPPPSPPLAGVVESEALPVGVDKVDEDDDFNCSSGSSSDNASSVSERSSPSDTPGEAMSTSTSSSKKSIGELSSGSSRLPVPDSPEQDYDQGAAPSLPAQPVPADSGTQQPEKSPSGTQQPEESPSGTQQPEESPSGTQQADESPTTDSASLNDEYSVGSTSVSAGSASESEPESDTVESSRDDQGGAPSAPDDNTGAAATLVSEEATPSRIITASSGGPPEPPNEEEDDDDVDVAADMDHNDDNDGGGTGLSTKNADSSDITIEPSESAIIMESSTTTSRPMDLQQQATSAEENPPGGVADARSTDKDDNGDGKPDVLEEVKYQEGVEACTADDDQVVRGEESNARKEEANVVAGTVIDEGSALPLTAHSTEPDTTGPVAEDAYKPDLEGINTEVDVDDLRARFSNVCTVAVTGEVSALPPTHATEPDTAGPVVGDACKPDLEGIDTEVDVDAFQARVLNVDTGAVAEEVPVLPLTHDTEPDTAGSVAEDVSRPDLEGIDTEVDVDALQARVSNVDTGAVAEEAPALPLSHDTEPDTAIGPVAEDAYRPDLDGIDTEVDVVDLRARFSNVCTRAVADEVPALPLIHSTESDTAGPVAEDACKPDFEGIDAKVDVDEARSSNVDGDAVSEEVPALPLSHDTEPDADGPVAEDAYKSDFEGIDAKDVDGLQARSLNVDGGAVAEEVSALPPTHATEPDADGPVAEDAYKPDFEGIDTAVDVDDLQARFSRMLGSYSDVPETPAAPLISRDAVAPADQSFESPQAPDTLPTENEEESIIPHSHPSAANRGECAETDPVTPPLENEEELNPQSQPSEAIPGEWADSAYPEVEENGQEGLGGFSSSPPDNLGTTESGVVEREEDGGVAVLSEEQYNIVDGGEKDSAPQIVSGASGDSARDGVLSSETPDDGPQLLHQQDVVVHDPPHTDGLEVAQEASVSHSEEDAEDANCSAESGLVVGVLSSEAPDASETPDDGTQHHHQGAIAHDASYTGGLETAQEVGPSENGDVTEGANGSAESGLVVGVLSSETPDEGTPHHHQQGVIAHDVSDTGGSETAQEAGISDNAGIEGANGSSATSQEEAGVSDNGDVEAANGSAKRGSELLNMVAKSSADSVPGEDGVREHVAEQRQQREDESDELYDIDDLETPSSEGN